MNSIFSLRALMTQEMQQERYNLRCHTAVEPAIYAKCSMGNPANVQAAHNGVECRHLTDVDHGLAKQGSESAFVWNTPIISGKAQGRCRLD
ncbi:MAG: hypothetical protein ACEPO2_15090 [Pelagibaca sp.]